LYVKTAYKATVAASILYSRLLLRLLSRTSSKALKGNTSSKEIEKASNKGKRKALIKEKGKGVIINKKLKESSDKDKSDVDNVYNRDRKK